jgi:BirA family biotin operon repressor/biotin-[acetyl-CoA-carboxylase] ligase
MNEKILSMFEQKPQQFISGEQLSKHLNCSRTAIWKHIRNLRLQGYDFEAIPKKGYRLIAVPSVMRVTSILSMLETQVMGQKITYAAELDSTQIRAHEMVSQGAVEGTIIIAEQQTQGRGTMGKKWFSPPGKGIWFSMILKPRIPLQFISQLTLLVSVALCRTIKKMLQVDIGIKWPNDLLIQGKKVSGILLESSGEDERLRYVVAGIGISANLLKKDFPPELRSKATSLRIAAGQEMNREELLCGYLLEFEKLYQLYNEQGFAPIRTLWEALSVSLNCPIEVQTSQGRVEGVAHGLDEMGALVITLEDGSTEKIYSGDVNHL